MNKIRYDITRHKRNRFVVLMEYQYIGSEVRVVTIVINEERFFEYRVRGHEGATKMIRHFCKDNGVSVEFREHRKYTGWSFYESEVVEPLTKKDLKELI